MYHNSRFESALRIFEKEIPHSRRVTRNSVKELNSRYDTFICGSDQIWNPIGWQTAFF